MLNLYNYEVIDWDDPDLDSDPETNNLLHCQQADHLGAQAEMIVNELLYEGAWAEVRFATQTAQYSVVGLALSSMWLVLFNDSHKRPDWLRPVSGWPAERSEIREWERVTGESWRGKR